jgi:hypothetical protein
MPSAPTPSLRVALYRASGFVPWHKGEVPEYPLLGRYEVQSGHRAEPLKCRELPGAEVFLARKVSAAPRVLDSFRIKLNEWPDKHPGHSLRRIFIHRQLLTPEINSPNGVHALPSNLTNCICLIAA